MATMSADSKKLKELGLIKPCKAPKKTPAKPPILAPKQKAVNFTVTWFNPNGWQESFLELYKALLILVLLTFLNRHSL